MQLVPTDLHNDVRHSGGIATGGQRGRGHGMIEVEADGSLDEADVRAFESKHGITLPDEYRTWLLDVGGGAAGRDYEIENGVLSEFLSLGGDVGYDLHTWRDGTEGFSAWVPRDHLIVAPGSGGSLSVKLSEPDRGSVWWADYDAAVDHLSQPGQDPDSGDPQPYIMRKLADSFLDFLTQYPL